MNIRSRVSLSVVRKRTIVSAPTSPRPRATSSPTASIIAAEITPEMAMLCVKLRRYERPA